MTTEELASEGLGGDVVEIELGEALVDEGGAGCSEVELLDKDAEPMTDLVTRMA